MSITLSFPGLVLFLLAGAAEVFWIAPTTKNAREAKIAGGVGAALIFLGAGLYAAGLILG